MFGMNLFANRWSQLKVPQQLALISQSCGSSERSSRYAELVSGLCRQARVTLSVCLLKRRLRCLQLPLGTFELRRDLGLKVGGIDTDALVAEPRASGESNDDQHD